LPKEVSVTDSPDREVTTLPPSADPRACSLLEKWRACCVDGTPPDRETLDVFDLQPWLGHICVYETVDGGADFRIRLEGTRVGQITGEDWTGRHASDVDARFATDLVGCMQKTVRTGRASLHTTRIYQRKFRDAVRLLLPMRSRRDGPVDQIFLALYLDPGPPP
jgi:hypothetical protein